VWFCFQIKKVSLFLPINTPPLLLVTHRKTQVVATLPGLTQASESCCCPSEAEELAVPSFAVTTFFFLYCGKVHLFPPFLRTRREKIFTIYQRYFSTHRGGDQRQSPFPLSGDVGYLGKRSSPGERFGRACSSKAARPPLLSNRRQA